MDANRKISEVELQRRALHRAMSLAEFCQTYGIGRTTAYSEIKQKRLRARKIGKRTVIVEDDAEDWLKCLPVIGHSREDQVRNPRHRSPTLTSRSQSKSNVANTGTRTNLTNSTRRKGNSRLAGVSD
jgi:predicted DNA-binding transcriptional regulator AlpA